MKNEPEHASLSPSGAHRWIECPGSIPLSAHLPDSTSPYAEEGTFAHGIAARCLESGQRASELIGETDGVFKVDAEMAGFVQEYLDEVRALLICGATLLTEQRVRLLGLCDSVYGTADAIVISADKKSVDVFDFKYGAGVFVPIENNPQLLIYGLGAILTHGLTAASALTLHIVQPRHRNGGHHWQDLEVRDVFRWFEDVLDPSVRAVREAEAATVDLLELGFLNAGDHCQFCPVKATCPELRGVALARTRHLFDDDAMQVPLSPPPSPAEMSIDEIAVALAAFPMVETWIKGVRDYAYEHARKGATIPGYKLVTSTGNRKWIDDDDTVLALSAFVDDGDIYAPRKLVSPAQAEKLLPKAQRGIVSKLAIKPKTGTVLVPDSDARPKIVSSVDVFENLP